MRKELICAAVAACALTLPGGAGASTVTVGTVTFNANAWADNASIATTSAGGTPATSPAGAADGNLSTAANLNDSFVEIFFTDNILVNGPGDDIVIFSNTNNNVIRLWNGPGGSLDTSITGGFNFIADSAPGNTSGFSLNAAPIDLSNLGFATGAEITDGLFLARGGLFSTVWDVAALNSKDVVTDPGPGPSVVPLPAAGWLLLGGLAGLFGLGRRRQA